MALTLEQFKARFPEFGQNTDLDTWITTALAQAEYLVADSWETGERDEILGLTAAANLAMSPYGRHAQLVSKDGQSAYSRELAARKRRHACAFNRVG